MKKIFFAFVLILLIFFSNQSYADNVKIICDYDKRERHGTFYSYDEDHDPIVSLKEPFFDIDIENKSIKAFFDIDMVTFDEYKIIEINENYIVAENELWLKTITFHRFTRQLILDEAPNFFYFNCIEAKKAL